MICTVFKMSSASFYGNWSYRENDENSLKFTSQEFGMDPLQA